jgi:hypothetical protein
MAELVTENAELALENSGLSEQLTEAKGLFLQVGGWTGALLTRTCVAQDGG